METCATTCFASQKTFTNTPQPLQPIHKAACEGSSKARLPGSSGIATIPSQPIIRFVFFARKMQERGYRGREVLDYAADRKKYTGIKKYTNKFVIMKYSSTVNTPKLSGILRRRADILNALGRKFKVGVSFSVQRNLFRRHYADNWLHTG